MNSTAEDFHKFESKEAIASSQEEKQELLADDDRKPTSNPSSVRSPAEVIFPVAPSSPSSQGSPPTPGLPKAVRSNSKRNIKKGLGSPKGKRAEDRAAIQNRSVTAPPLAGATASKRKRGLGGTKFQPARSSTSLPETPLPSSPIPPNPDPDPDPDPIEFTAVAQLVTEKDGETFFDEEEIRQQARIEAEERLLSNVTLAEVVGMEDQQINSNGNNTSNGSKKQYLIGFLFMAVVVVIGIMVASILTTRDAGNPPVASSFSVPASNLTGTELKHNATPEIPSFEPSSAPAIAPSTAPSTAPSMAPSAAPSISPLINDLCLGAIGLEGNMFISGSTKKATFDEGIATCGDIVENGRGQWYEIIGQNAQLRAHTCFGNTTSLDTQLSVYQGGTMGDSHSCSAVTCIAGNDEHNCGHGSFVQWFGYENMTY